MKNLDFLKKEIIAHRGYHDEKNPENSLGAFKKAILHNYIIELDVHLLKDNTIVVFHDDNLKRMTGLNKNLKDLTYDDIKNLKLLNTKYEIPKLEEVLKLVNGKVPIIVELKYDRKLGLLEHELVKHLDNYKGKFAVKSFNPLTVNWFKKKKPNYIRGLLVGLKNDNFKDYVCYKMILLNLCKPDFISCQKSMINNKKIKKFHKKNIVIAWTIKSQKGYDKYLGKYDNLICENINNICLREF